MNKRFYKTVLVSWLIFVGLDFLFHAGIIKNLWHEPVAAFLPDKELFNRIPLGYLSFLLLTILIGLAFIRIYREKPSTQALFKLAGLAGLLFASSNFLALYSFINAPLKHLLIFNVVYWLEMVIVFFLISEGLYTLSFRKYASKYVTLFLLLITLGVLIQNISK